jgi:hypothetical protein
MTNLMAKFPHFAFVGLADMNVKALAMVLLA